MSEQRLSLFLKRIKFDPFLVRKTFVNATSDTSGINHEQLRNVLSEMGFLVPPATSVIIQGLFAACDRDGTRRVSWSKFRGEFLEPLSSTNRLAKLNFAYNAFNIHQVRAIPRRDFVEVLEEVYRFMIHATAHDQEELREIMRIACPGDSRNVTKDNFVAAAGSSALALAVLSFGTVHTKATHAIATRSTASAPDVSAGGRGSPDDAAPVRPRNVTDSSVAVRPRQGSVSASKPPAGVPLGAQTSHSASLLEPARAEVPR
eukprot:CAMPEP_0119142438 /NCGR_PEP_ID=MMETSP1310-20130426/32638_1 /TAXON_ID=464262 /ORGANISM="Genus nov. species nov., Strain RCC2339" /LENGTH=259 /DNA_ID=CAMNT_0007133977 /DNA_START=29 /DNA_END=805 /DNA_ORIENTATION=-